MALIKGQEVKETPHQYPTNPRLWNLITTQAKTKFSKYPSPAAAHWVHTRYIQLGGQFVDSKKDVDPRMRDRAQEERDKAEEKQKGAVRKDVTKKVTKNVTKPVAK
jgi:hypothetical protein